MPHLPSGTRQIPPPRPDPLTPSCVGVSAVLPSVPRACAILPPPPPLLERGDRKAAFHSPEGEARTPCRQPPCVVDATSTPPSPTGWGRSVDVGSRWRFSRLGTPSGCPHLLFLPISVFRPVSACPPRQTLFLLKQH
eukprot:EG_transcript_20861